MDVWTPFLSLPDAHLAPWVRFEMLWKYLQKEVEMAPHSMIAIIVLDFYAGVSTTNLSLSVCFVSGTLPAKGSS